MHKIKDARHIWDNGCETKLAGLSSEEIWAFKSRTGAKSIYQVAWNYGHVRHCCTYPAELLPDATGVVSVSGVVPGQPLPAIRQSLDIINADGSLRGVVKPPVIDERSDPGKAWLETPQNFKHLGIEFGVPASDGWRLLVMDINWNSGEMLRWVLAPGIIR